MIKKIIFDVGNVVIIADENITFKRLQEYGLDEDNSLKFYNNNDYSEYSRGNISSEEFYKILITKYLKFNFSYDQIMNAHNEHIYGIDKEVIELFNQIHGDLVFLTDTNEWQTIREKELVDLSLYSNKIFRSHEIHMLKIDEGCFSYIIQDLECEPDEIILIDDSLEKIENAKKNGLNTIHFVDATQLKQELIKIKIIK